MTSLSINLYHKQYTFTHKWSLLKVAPLFYYYDFLSPPFKIFLNEGLIECVLRSHPEVVWMRI